MRTWVLVALLASVTFAGCFGGDEPAGEPDDGMDHGDGMGECPTDDAMDGDMDAGNETAEGNESANETGGSRLLLRQQGNETQESGNESMEQGNETMEHEDAMDDDPCPDDNGADGNATNALPDPVVGVDIKTAAVPVDITYTFDATDADGDNLTWSLDVDGDGEAESEGTENNLPGNYTHTFDTAGTYEALFTVSDGVANVTANVTVNIQEPVPEADPWIFEGYFSEPCQQCVQGANTGVGYRSGQQGLDYVWAEIPADYVGTPYFAKTTGKVVGLSFRDGCSGGGAVETPATTGQTLEGVVPEGAVCVLMWEQGDTRGGKLSFIADGDNSMFPADPLCYTNDFVLVGFNQGSGVYQTDGTWFYIEDNGVPGLQWNNNPSPPPLSEVHGKGAACEGGDTMII